MMQPVKRIEGSGASASTGSIRFDWPKACWFFGLAGSGLALAPFSIAWDSLLVFAALTYATLLIGHSVGMHRMMIHRSFEAPRWLERSLIYVGVIVGMAGPFGKIRTHDLRDWAQRQPHCHDFFAHRRSYLRDLTWQLAYRFEFDRPPRLTVEPRFSADPFLCFLERSWRLHQLGLAALLYALGGWTWVVWGVLLRVPLSIASHWTVTHHCHRPGPGRFGVRGAYVQAADLPGLGLLTFGECWHSNHHAFPESARIGLYPGQVDPSWQVIRLLERLGLAQRVGLPRAVAERDDLYLREAARKANSPLSGASHPDNPVA